MYPAHRWPFEIPSDQPWLPGSAVAAVQLASEGGLHGSKTSACRPTARVRARRERPRVTWFASPLGFLIPGFFLMLGDVEGRVGDLLHKFFDELAKDLDHLTHRLLGAHHSIATLRTTSCTPDPLVARHSCRPATPAYRSLRTCASPPARHYNFVARAERGPNAQTQLEKTQARAAFPRIPSGTRSNMRCGWFAIALARVSKPPYYCASLRHLVRARRCL